MKRQYLIAMFLSSLILPTTLMAQTVRPLYVDTKIEINERNVTMDAFIVDGKIYTTVRSLAQEFSGTIDTFDVIWNPVEKITELKIGHPYSGAHKEFTFSGDNMHVTPNTSKLKVGNSIYTFKTYTMDGTIYYGLEDLAQLIGFEVIARPEKGKLDILTENETRQVISTDLPYVSVVYKNTNSRWAHTNFHSLAKTEEGLLQAVVEGENEVLIHNYTPEGKLQSTKTLPLELSIHGGFYQGIDANYIVSGDKNVSESLTKEVIRVVKYDRNFNKIDTLSLTGEDIRTTVPFDAGSLRMAETEDDLIIHTSRERFKSRDGLNHQSQLTLVIDKETMTLKEKVTDFQSNHVSHSFNQFVRVDGDKHILIDHGDAYPRSIVLHRGDGQTYEKVDLFDIPGLVGANATGISVGGLEVTTDNYMVAFNTVNHDLITNYTSFGLEGTQINTRDVVLAIVPKNNLNKKAVKHIKLTNYAETNKTAYPPHLVKLHNDEYMVLWEEIQKDGISIGSEVKYAIVDGNGKIVQAIKTLPDGELSDCQPIYTNGEVVWIVDIDNTRILYSIPVI